MPLAFAIPELYDPLYHSQQDDLYEIYRRLRDDYPVYHCECRDVWCLSRFDDVQAAARDWETFSNANGVDLDLPRGFLGAGNFIDEDPPHHDVLRKIVRPFFVPKEIARLEAKVARRAEDLAGGLSEAERVDIAQEFAWALPIWVICRLLGVPEADDELVHDLVSELETRLPGEDSPAQRIAPTLQRFFVYIDELAEHKRKAPSEDLMTHLVASEAGGALSREEVRGVTRLLFAAGSETTASLIGNTLSLLAEHREAQRLLREQPLELIDAVIEESLRMESPVQYLARRTTTPVLVDHIEVPKDTDVILIYGAANRDERHFESADTFDITRESRSHLAFGEGIHFCLGAPLARLEARVAIPAFLRAIPSYDIAAPTERYLHHTIRGYAHLPAIID